MLGGLASGGKRAKLSSTDPSLHAESESIGYCTSCEMEHDWSLYTIRGCIDFTDPQTGRRNCKSSAFQAFSKKQQRAPSHYCIPPLNVLQFGATRWSPKYRVAYYKRAPMFETEEIVAAYYGGDPHFPSFEQWIADNATHDDDGLRASGQTCTADHGYESALRQSRADAVRRARLADVFDQLLQTCAERVLECCARAKQTENRTAFLADGKLLDDVFHEESAIQLAINSDDVIGSSLAGDEIFRLPVADMPTPLTVRSLTEKVLEMKAIAGAEFLGSSGRRLPLNHVVSTQEPIAVRCNPVRQYVVDKRSAEGFGASTTDAQLYDSLRVNIIYSLAERIMKVNSESANQLRITNCDVDRMGSGLYNDFYRYNSAGCHLYSESMDAVRQYAEQQAATFHGGQVQVTMIYVQWQT